MKYAELKDLAEIKLCVISASRLSRGEEELKTLVCTNFLRDNTIDMTFSTTDLCLSEEYMIHKGDIIVKRISPTFVNYISDIPFNIYAGNNLIIITPTDKIYGKYLAMALNDKIENLSSESSVGAVMKSVNRQELGMLQIPYIPYEKQVLVGNMWYDGIELEKMKHRLITLERTKQQYQIKKYMETCGGKHNG